MIDMDARKALLDALFEDRKQIAIADREQTIATSADVDAAQGEG